jgi:TPR repeat protein
MAGARYEQGAIVPRDLAKASALYLRGCDYGTGDGPACARAAPAVARTDPKQGLAMYRRACLAGRDVASCLTVGDILARDAADRATANEKSFYLAACNETHLAEVCAKSTALGNPSPAQADAATHP